MAEDSKSLTDLFDRGFQLHSSIANSNQDQKSSKFQDEVKKAILILEDATRLVSVLDIFSKNEKVEEVPVEHLKYFLLPVLLGDLNGKIFDEGTERCEVLRIQEVYYCDFLERCNDYGICDVNLKKEETAVANRSGGGRPDLARMNQEREQKLKEYREMKDIEARLKELQEILRHPSADEDVVKEFYLKNIRRFVKLTLDELKTFEMERGILEHMKKVKEGDAEPLKQVRSRPLKPIIITKDKFQKEVFGMGYKHLPILSIEEFYEQRVRDGWFPDPEEVKKQTAANQKSLQDHGNVREQEEEEAAEKEKKEEEDDEEELQKKRNWDEYLDTHRKGEGNRHNMG